MIIRQANAQILRSAMQTMNTERRLPYYNYSKYSFDHHVMVNRL